MAKLSVKPGSTDVTVMISVSDSSSTTGGKLTGLVWNSAGLTAYYTRTRSAATVITLATLAAVDSAHSDGGFKEIDATNAPGLYRLDLPDAVCAAGARSAVVTLKGAANMVQVDLEIDLASEVDVKTWFGTEVAGVDTAGYPKVTIKDGTGAGEINLNAGTIVNVDTVLGSVDGSVLGNVAGSVGSVGGDVIGSVLGNVTGVLNPVTAGTVTDKTGYALTAAYDAAKTAAQAGNAMTLTVAYDAAKTAATQTSVNDLPTLAEMEASTKLLRSIVSGQNTVNVSATGTVASTTAGTGSVPKTYNLTNAVSQPVSDADVWVSTDNPYTNVIASGKTDAFGNVTFHLDPGTYFFWQQKAGYNPPLTNPVTVVVS